MRNPADEWNEKELEARRKSEALVSNLSTAWLNSLNSITHVQDAALATTHGARAFKDYVLLQPNGTAMPKVVNIGYTEARINHCDIRLQFLKHVNTKNQNKLWIISNFLLFWLEIIINVCIMHYV